ncbi:MAG: murein L,D-transpeptidase family protein [Candidatus Kapaibacterium sp.]
MASIRKTSLAVFLIFIFFASSSAAGPAHFNIVIKKAERKLYLYENDSLVKTYKIALGLAPVGRKQMRGDQKTPQGEYYISSKNSRSQFYRALGISYPNAEDAGRGLNSGIITKNDFRTIQAAIRGHLIPPQHTSLGGEIFIHGNGTSRDWTWGCVALEDTDIKELFDKIPVRTPVTIEQ